MDIYINSEIGACDQYMPGEEAENETVSIVISPVRIIREGEDESVLRVISGCNMWASCRNKRCYLCMAGRPSQRGN